MKASMRLARLPFLGQNGIRFRPQNIQPNFLVVPPALRCDIPHNLPVRLLSHNAPPTLDTESDGGVKADEDGRRHPIASDRAEIEKYLKLHDINVSDPSAPPPALRFQESGLPDHLLSCVASQFEHPTPIQSQALPIALEGRNMVGIGQTGSGKTLAFLLPALVYIGKHRQAGRGVGKYRGPLALILAPTRELAKQIEEVAVQYRKISKIRTVCCIGGESKMRQLDFYDNEPHLMIATPGRINDFLQAGDMSLSDVGYVVLDEADRMLDMGFEPQVRSVLEAIRPERQVVMFSATWPEDVRELAREFLNEYTFMNIGSTELTANKNITQQVVVCNEMSKQSEFLDKMEELSGAKVLVFTERKIAVDRLERILRNRGIRAMGIHGDKSQSHRSNVLRKFKDGQCNCMIATDVAARGLDINDVEFVVNYDFPLDIENYVHRIGRTARSNKTGTSVTFITEKEARFAHNLVKILKDCKQEVNQDLYNLIKIAKEEKHQRKSVKGPIGRQRMYDERRSHSLPRYRHKGLREDDWDSPRSYDRRPQQNFGRREEFDDDEARWDSPRRNERRPRSATRANRDYEGYVYDNDERR